MGVICKKEPIFFKLNLFSLVAVVLLLILLIIPEATNLYMIKEAEKSGLALHFAGTANAQMQAPTHAKPLDTAALKQSSWYAGALKSIYESEYEIGFDAGSGTYASPNRSQNLRAFYTANKFTLQPRNDSADNWHLELTTKGVYVGDSLIYQPDEQSIVSQNRDSIRFNAQNFFITEYINNAAGIRQNFIIEKEPDIKSSNISVKLEVNEGWLVNKVHDKEIHFAKAAENGYDKKLTYNQLKVWDATGKELKSFFTTEENNISINVNTTEAVYPITIDPLSTGTAGTPDWAVADANQVNAYSGLSVASAGDVNGDGYSDVIVGAYAFDDGANTDEGRAFVYYGSATGLSTTPNSTPDDADQSSAYFGITVASAGDVNGDGYSDVIIGATGYDDGGNIDEGRAFVYYGSAAGLSTLPNSILDDADKPGAFLGTAVACAGDVNGDGYSDVIIGAYGYDDGPNVLEGRAFLYHGSATGLSAAPNSTPDDADQAQARFGVSVASAGDVNGDGYSDVIIGAHFYNDGANTNEGRAFVYYGSPTGIGTSPDNTPDDADQASVFFSRSVACAGDVNGDGYSDVIIGAFQYDDGGNTDEGRAFVYYGSITGLSASPGSTPDDGDQAGAFFGWQVAGAGDINGDGYSDVIIGAQYYDDGANLDEGRAFVYYGSAAGLSASPVSMPDDADQPFANFGWSVSAAGDVNGDGYSDVIIGALNYDDGANTDEGHAFVYNGAPDGLSVAPLVINNITQNQSGFGYAVTTAGDVNNDGFSDVIISAPWFDDNGGDEGRAFVYYGSTSGISITADVVLDEANQGAAYFGYSLGSAGDVNGDGFSDVIVGAYGYNGKGRAYVYFGSVSGLSATSNQVLDGTQAGEAFGVSVATAGDVNHDGYSDVIIGAYLYDDGANADEGRALIYHGSAAGLITTPITIISDANQPGAYFGVSVSNAGDVNGDGYSDIIIGSYGYDKAGNTDEGAVFVYYGSCTGIPAVANLMITGAAQATAYYGFSVSSAGDINGDGFGDVIVGSFFYNSQKGRAYVFYGSGSGLSTTPFILENSVAGSANGDRMGYSVSTAGDINGDGYSDIIIGVVEYNNPGSGPPQGRAFVYLGKTTGVNAAPDIIITDNVNNQQFFGTSVAAAGDVNGDGFSDIVVGGYKGSWSGFGMAWIFNGNNIGGLRNNLRLYNTNLFTPINQSNINDATSFGAGLYAKSFLGNQKGKLVWQTIGNGNTFTGLPITNSAQYTAQQSAYTNLGLNGIELKTVVAKTTVSANTYTRVRVKYDPVSSITGQVYGPWKYTEGYLRGSRAIADVAMSVLTFSVTLGNDTAVCFPYTINATTAGATNYTWQNGATGATFNTTAAGLYWVDIHLYGCTYRDTIVLTGSSGTLANLSPKICQSQTYTSPSGNTYNSTGIYKDTLRSVNGCDSMIYTIDLAVQAATAQLTTATICVGQNYTLPWGTVVSAAGTYRDTLRYTITNCDSVYRIVDLTVQTTGTTQSTNAAICGGQTYTLPWGTIVSFPGIYRDTIRNVFGCDSIYRIVDLAVKTVQSQNMNVNICTGQTYTLPWGTVVNTTGIYSDTTYYTTGCDSIRRTVNLMVEIPLAVITNPTICVGQSYTLPWGTVVNTPGVYMDTLRSIAGCDSIRRTVNLTILTAISQVSNPVICEGTSYTLPWGAIVSTAGTYRDTLRGVFGCDSVRRIVNLSAQSVITFITNPIICAGQTYTLPWGPIVNTTGIYSDTLHYTTGCDSIRRTVNLKVEIPLAVIANPTICTGQTYTLPWGTVVNTPGVYMDTLRSIAGCDSIRRTVNLTILTAISQVSNPVICEGSSYTLPWGTIVSTAGTYRDTLRGVFGCDSVRRIVNLTVQSVINFTTNPIICAGQTYTLPWGPIVNTTGIYSDTLHYTTGCDSIRRTVNLMVEIPLAVITNPTICTGQTYTLPWGTVVNTPGVYMDTLRSIAGCDSIRRTVNLTILTAVSQVSNPVICEGGSYTLPWGTIVSTAGTYRDTLRGVFGCDSVRRIVNLSVQSVINFTTNPIICAGQTYTLPSGTVVNTAGIYRDTLYYTTGCDSVRRTFNLQVTAAAVSIINAAICSDKTYTLPWNVITNTAGIYKDTVRNAIGCDSLVRAVNLIVNPLPSVSISKSNDVDCVLGISKLEATGGVRYSWMPSSGLNDVTIYNPIASPTSTTLYSVLVTSDKGCTAEKSIQVNVSNANNQNAYLLPNAFTPNGDGKNDCFGVQTWGAVTDLEFSIFSRWGERVFNTKNPNQCWDGSFKGSGINSGVYIYFIRAKGLCGDILRKGTVVLIR